MTEPIHRQWCNADDFFLHANDIGEADSVYRVPPEEEGHKCFFARPLFKVEQITASLGSVSKYLYRGEHPRIKNGQCNLVVNQIGIENQ